ncbi:MAG: caspase family protein [Candidatus Sericytochromatia bacterium]|nr:caspase family protein [Candidatus Sericytochromatia bacterium]
MQGRVVVAALLAAAMLNSCGLSGSGAMALPPASTQSLGANATQGATFEPAKTYALFMGVLEWKDPDLEPFPKEDRADRALERTLLARGVPKDHIIFLEDRQATLKNAWKALADIKAKMAPGSTLLIYFAGHGIRERGVTWLANHDIDLKRLPQTGLALSELTKRLIKDWRGERLLLLADCCYSGALAEVVQAVGAKGIKAASLSSVSPTDGSTERWTFTESLVRAWTGETRLDLNGDRRVSFAETDTYIHDQMKYGEEQLTHGSRAGGFEPEWQFSTAASVPPPAVGQSRWSVGDYAESQSQGKWERVQVLSQSQNSAFVHFLTRADRFDASVPADGLRAVPPTRFTNSQRVQVEYDGKWETARIQQSAEGFFHFVHYETLDDSDEWVTDKRLRKIGGTR